MGGGVGSENVGKHVNERKMNKRKSNVIKIEITIEEMTEVNEAMKKSPIGIVESLK